VPASSYFLVSAVFHYLGPSLAVLLFVHVGALGVAWLRIASAAVVFAVWRRPWRLVHRLGPAELRVLLALGAVLGMMNSLFYLAIARLPLSTVGAIEFLGTVVLAAVGIRTRRNALAVVLAVAGVGMLTAIRLGGAPLGFVFAFANCAGFMVYVMLGHRIANTQAMSGDGGAPVSSLDRLGASMLIAAVVATPFGIGSATAAFSHPRWLLWGIGVGISSSVIPYVTDQLAMARMARATFALMLALLPMFATLIGAVVLHQLPTLKDLLGIALVVAAVGIHRTPDDEPGSRSSTPPRQPRSP
jgi:inner membrane transporter RhtA